MKETLKHQQAFEFYYELGAERSLAKVASKFDVSRTSATKWSQEFGWEQRIKERDNKNMEAVRNKTDEEVIERMINYRKIISDSINDYAKRLQDEKIEINSVNELVKLISLDMKLCGFLEQGTNNQQYKDDLQVKQMENKNKLLEAQIKKLTGDDDDNAYIKGFATDLDQIDDE